MAVGQVDSTSLEPIVILGLLNSMAVVVANADRCCVGVFHKLSMPSDATTRKPP